MRPRSPSTPCLPGSPVAPSRHTGLLLACAMGLTAGCSAKSEEDAKSADEVDLGAPAPDLVLPDLSDVDLEAVWMEAMQAVLAARGTNIWAGSTRALDRRFEGCPDIYVGAPPEADLDEDDDARADGLSWSDYCETSGGLYYRGYQHWRGGASLQGDPESDAGRVSDARRTLLGDGTVGDPQDTFFEFRGTAEDTLYRVEAGDYQRWSWSSSFVGTATGSDIFEPVSSPLAGGLRADLYMASAGGDASTLELRGDAYFFERRLQDRFDSVSLDVSMVGPLSAGPEDCTLEPRGWIGVRDSNAWWVDVVFQPTADDDLSTADPDDPYTACDGCGTLYLRGLDQTIELGQVCTDFSAIWADPLLQPVAPETFIYVVRELDPDDVPPAG